MFKFSLLSFGIIVQHLSLHILLAVPSAEELLLFLQLTTEITVLNALKTVRHTRNADVGQPGHLCLLFMDLALSRARRKASWFPCACRMDIWFIGKHVKVLVFEGLAFKMLLKSTACQIHKPLAENHSVTWDWRGIYSTLPLMARAAVTPDQVFGGIYHPTVSAFFLLGWIYWEAEMQMNQCTGYKKARFGWFSAC